jgi:ABC-type branched-subunit amino acid transport system permease subunit
MQPPIFAFSGPKDWALVALAALILALLPVVFDDPFFILVMQSLAYLFIVTLGLDILVGWTGQISLGHAGLYAVGAYTTALASARLGLPFWLSAPLGVALAGLFGAVACGTLAARQGPLSRHGDDRVRLHGRGDKQPLEPHRRADGDHVDPAADAS